ncbi:MAG: hypothetical protein WD711_02665 [Dongiaceae bacterium]
MKFSYLISAAFIASLVAAPALVPQRATADEIAAAPAAAPNDTILTDGGTRYACAGTAESKFDPRWDEFAAKIVTAASNGTLLGHVDIAIADAAGAPVLDVFCEAPWLLADVAPGSYTAHVVARDGQFEETVSFDVAATGQTEVLVSFDEIYEP